MKLEEFWRIIEEVKLDANPEIIIKPILRKLTLRELRSYEKHLHELHRAAYRDDLWDVVDEMWGSCSGDDFEYFLYGLISKGKSVYNAALENPEILFEIPGDFDKELFGYAAMEVLEEKSRIAREKKNQRSAKLEPLAQ